MLLSRGMVGDAVDLLENNFPVVQIVFDSRKIGGEEIVHVNSFKASESQDVYGSNFVIKRVTRTSEPFLWP